MSLYEGSAIFATSRGHLSLDFDTLEQKTVRTCFSGVHIVIFFLANVTNIMEC